MSRPLIELTPDQLAELERQKRTEPSHRRVSLELTEQQRRRVREAAEIEQAGKEENIAAYRRMVAAEREPTLSGDLRRAIKGSRHSLTEIAAEIGITPLQLDAFRSGDEELSSHVMDRLASLLQMSLAPTADPGRRSDH